MNKIVSLTKNKEFKYVYYRGKYKAHPLLVTYMAKNRLGIVRIGITTSKKIGKAFQRNRAKRMIKAAYQMNPTKFVVKNGQQQDGWDIVFMARPDTPFKKSTDIARIMGYQMDFLRSRFQ